MATKKLKSKSKPKSKRIVKPHNWTDGGDKVLILRCCNKDGSSYGGFIWPRTGEVSAPDWNNRKECGGGLHGWPWGMGIGEGKDFNFSDDLWIVFAVKPEDVVGELDNGWKCKAKCGVVVYAGEFAAAWQMVNSGRHRLIEAMVGVGGRNSSKAASSGNSSKAASSGNSSKAASSGNYSTAASSGDYSKAASSGDYSTAASSGNYSKAASSGNSSTAASSGDSSTAASSGNYSTAASSGNYSTAASSGDYSKAASSGDYSTAASSGNYSKAASSGNSSTAASSGNSSKAASSGNYSTAASSGDSSKASASGELTIAMVAGLGGMARAGLRGAFALPWKDGDRVRIAVGIVGEDGIEPDTWYAVKSGQLLKV
jgi:hypothetical protein